VLICLSGGSSEPLLSSPHPFFIFTEPNKLIANANLRNAVSLSPKFRDLTRRDHKLAASSPLQSSPHKGSMASGKVAQCSRGGHRKVRRQSTPERVNTARPDERHFNFALKQVNALEELPRLHSPSPIRQPSGGYTTTLMNSAMGPQRPRRQCHSFKDRQAQGPWGKVNISHLGLGSIER